MKNKLLFTFIAICICIFAIGTISVLADTYGDLTYSVSNDEITITRCNTSATSVTIPSEIDGKPVTSIGYSAFYGCTGLTSVTIPNSVTSIGSSAFRYCESLASVSIGSGITSIGESAFSDCYNLESVYITDLVAYLNCEYGGSYSNPMYYASKQAIYK